MADGDIQISLGDGAFRLHDIAIAVVGFGDDRFGLCFGAGADDVHRPEYLFEQRLFSIVHRIGYFPADRPGQWWS